MALQPRHTEAILTPGSGIGSDARFADVAALNAAKGQPLERQWARRSLMGIEAINAAKAQRQAQQAQNSVDAHLLGKLLECHVSAISLCQQPVIQAQNQRVRLAAYFMSIARGAEDIASQLVQNPE